MISILQTLMSGQFLDAKQAAQVMVDILDDQVTPEQIGMMLAALHFRPPTAMELSGFASTLRGKSIEVSRLDKNQIIDVCGTGGDGHSTFNVSTVVSFIVASCGVKVAKHGNRAVSSQCGSFDVLEELGISFAADIDTVHYELDNYNLSFLFAPTFSPLLKKIALLRKNLGIKTIFNGLGPLLNPVRAGRQLMGVYSEHLILPTAEALKNLNVKEALVVRGECGLDEVSLAGVTRMAHLKNGQVELKIFHPNDVGMAEQSLSSIAGGSRKDNARILLDVLSGRKSPYRDMSVLNAGSALMVSGKADSIVMGIKLAEEAIDSGQAIKVLYNMQNNSKLRSVR